MGEFDMAREVAGFVENMKRDNPEACLAARVKAAWNDIVDDSVARHVVAVFVVPHTHASDIVVYVDSSLYAADLEMQSELLKLKLNMQLRAMGDGSKGDVACVEHMRFTLSKESFIERKRNRAEKALTMQDMLRDEQDVRPIALEEGEFDEVEESLSHIDDDTLRAVAYDAAKANLEWQKGMRSLEC